MLLSCSSSRGALTRQRSLTSPSTASAQNHGAWQEGRRRQPTAAPARPHFFPPLRTPPCALVPPRVCYRLGRPEVWTCAWSLSTLGTRPLNVTFLSQVSLPGESISLGGSEKAMDPRRSRFGRGSFHALDTDNNNRDGQYPSGGHNKPLTLVLEALTDLSTQHHVGSTAPDSGGGGGGLAWPIWQIIVVSIGGFVGLFVLSVAVGWLIWYQCYLPAARVTPSPPPPVFDVSKVPLPGRYPATFMPSPQPGQPVASPFKEVSNTGFLVLPSQSSTLGLMFCC